MQSTVQFSSATHLKLISDFLSPDLKNNLVSSLSFVCCIWHQAERVSFDLAMKKMRKVAEFLKKAMGALRGKASVLRARLLFLASLRRRMAVVGAISHHLRALMPGNAAAAAPDGRGKASLAAAEEVDDEQLALDDVAGISELASLFQEVDDGARYPDWTHSLFDDDDGEGGGDESVEEEMGEEASVMEVIRRRREGDGEEFDMEEEIDHAADMFIRRVRNRMAANRRSF